MLEPVGYFAIERFRTGIEKFFIILMLINYVEKAFVTAICSIKHFTLPVQNKFLKIQGYRFCNAKVFGILRYSYFHFFANAKEMVDGISAGKYYGGISGNINFLFSKIFCQNTFYNDKGIKI